VAWNFLRTTGTLRYFFVVFDERHFWLMRTDKHSVMVADDILHSHCGLQTCIVMGKKIIAYEREHPWYNTQKGDGIDRSSNSVIWYDGPSSKIGTSRSGGGGGKRLGI
jgi:hypothetical protein